MLQPGRLSATSERRTAAIRVSECRQFSNGSPVFLFGSAESQQEEITSAAGSRFRAGYYGVQASALSWGAR